MHELSVVMSIVDIAQEETRKAGAAAVEEIEMDIGLLSTIEMNAFEFAWQQGIRETVLEHAHKKINRIRGKGRCMDCNNDFALEHLYDPCPVCGNYLIDIVEGKELRVRSLVVS
ncbi:MAG: hydrogenase maturation nickel metallochaperone HypA [Ferruginibacter sp.]